MHDVVVDAVADALESFEPRALPKRLTQAELAEVWQVSERTIFTLRERGLPVLWVADSPRFELAECEAWARARQR